MNYIDVLKKPVVRVEDIKKSTKPMPLYLAIEALLAKNNDNLSVASATIMEEIDKAILDFTEVSSPDVKIEAKKELDKLLSATPPREYKPNENRIASLKRDLKTIMGLTKVIESFPKKYKDMNPQQLENTMMAFKEKSSADKQKKVDKLLALEESASKKIESKYKEQASVINNKIKELEGAKGKDVEEQRKGLQSDADKLRDDKNDKLEALEYGKKIAALEKDTNPIQEYSRAKSRLSNMFKGTFSYKPILDEEKLKNDASSSIKPRDIKGYKDRIKAYESLPALPTNKKNQQNKRNIRIKQLELQIKTGSRKQPLIASQTSMRRGKGNRNTQSKNTTLTNAIKELNLPTYEEEILNLLQPKKKDENKDKRVASMSKQEEALNTLIDELPTDDIDSDTKSRLRTNNILNNKFLFNLQENVTGERSNLHPEIMNKLSINDIPTPKFAMLVTALKSINPKMKVGSKSSIQRAMSKLRTSKTNIYRLARQVIKDPTNFNVSDLNKLTTQVNVLFNSAKESASLGSEYSENLKSEKRNFDLFFDASIALVDELRAKKLLMNARETSKPTGLSPDSKDVELDSIDLDGTKESLFELKRNIRDLRMEEV